VKAHSIDRWRRHPVDTVRLRRVRRVLSLALIGWLGVGVASCSSGTGPLAGSFCAGIRHDAAVLHQAAGGVSTFTGTHDGLGDAGLDAASTNLFHALGGSDQADKVRAVAEVHAACSRLRLW
jgi:hypothetical protein